MPNKLPNKRFYTVKEVAKLLNFSTNTVYKYLDEGKIVSTRLGSEGRFRIPAAEVAKLVQETEGQVISQINPPVNQADVRPEFHIQGAPSLFDWFIGFLSIGLGSSQFIFPDYSLSSSITPYIFYIKILQIALLIAGIGLISFDILKLKKEGWHNLNHVILGVLYLLLTILLFRSDSIPRAIGYFSAAIIILLTTFKKFSEYTRFLFYVNTLYITLGIAILVWPASFLLGTSVTPSIINLSVFFAIWLVGLILSIFLSIRAAGRRTTYMRIFAFSVSVVSFSYATFAFANGFWGRSIYCLILGSFAVIFPFSDHFQSFTLKSKKELLGSFFWLTGIFSIGSIVLYFIYYSFQNYILLELKNRVNTASDIASTFMVGNIARVTSFAEDSELINFVKKGSLTDIDQKLRLIYLTGNGALRRVVLVGSDGIIISTYPYLISSSEVDVSGRDFFINAKNSKGTSVSGILQPSTPGAPSAVVITAPIIDADGNFLGVLNGSVDISELTKEVELVKFGETGKIYLSDASKNYIIPPTEDKIMTKIPDGSSISSAVDGRSGAIQGYNSSGILSFIAYKNIANLGWGITAEQSISEVFATYSVTGFAIYLVFVMSGVGSLVFIIYSRKGKD